MIAAAFGVTRIKVDNSLSQLFRSNTPEFKQYEEVTRRFPSSEFDVLVVVEGKDLLARDSVEKLRDLVIDLQLVDGARGVISMARRASPGKKQDSSAFVSRSIPEGAAYGKLIDRVMANEIICGKLLSQDGQLTLVVLALAPEVAESNELRAAVDDIHKR